MQAAELQVLKNEYKRALQEPPWDGYCGLVKASEDDSILQPMSSPMDIHTENDAGLSPADSEAASQQDVSSEAVGSPLGPAPVGMQFAKQAFDQPTAVTIGYSARHDSAEHLQMKLESLQKAEDLSAAGTHGQQVRIAEEAFAQALQSLEQGDVAAAVNLLKVAQAACPASKPQAQARIILLLGRCQQMTGPAKPATASAMTTSAKSAAPSQSLPNNSYMQHPAQTSGHIKHSSNEVDANVEDGDEQKADQSFQSGLEALNRGDLAAAMQHLQDARTSCPRSKSSALVKIQRFINLIEAQEKRAPEA